MEREIIKLTTAQVQAIVYDDSAEYNVRSSEITGTFRHGNENTAIVQRVSDGKYFEIDYRDSVKDECDFEGMNYGGEYKEVFPVEKTIIVFE